MLKSKLRSQSGATILLALLFFLLCAIVGTIVLTSGSAAAGRIAGIEEQEQAYYTVTSAARLMAEEIEGQEFGYCVTEENGSESSREYTIEPSCEIAGLLKTAGAEVFKAVEGNQTGYVYSDKLTIYPSTDAKKKHLENVECAFNVKSDYSIEMTLSLAGENADKYTCRVTIPALLHKDRAITTEVTEPENEGGDPTIYTRTETRLIWSEAVIEKEKNDGEV